MTIFTPYHTHFLLIREPSKFCRELRANPPPSDPCPPPCVPPCQNLYGKPCFNSSLGAYWAIILSVLIIILFKERINDYQEKKMGQYLENWPRYCNFCRPKKNLKKFENTCLVAPGALAHRLQRLQNQKWPPVGPKMANGV